MTAPTRAQLDDLRRSFSGDIIEPDSGEYDEARRVWNAMFDRRPALVVRPLSVADVQAAVRFGRERDLEIAVRGGGHSAVGHSTTDGGLVIDMGRMNAVTVDPGRRLATAAGGALLGTLDIAAQEHGLVCPVGVVGHTGVAGLTLGGGVGRLQRNFGLTIDSLRAVELVTADGRVVRATAEDEPELFWGLRGAGANFGVATSLELELHPSTARSIGASTSGPRRTSTRSGRRSATGPRRLRRPSPRSSRSASARPTRTTLTPSPASRSRSCRTTTAARRPTWSATSRRCSPARRRPRSRPRARPTSPPSAPATSRWPGARGPRSSAASLRTARPRSWTRSSRMSRTCPGTPASP